VGIDIESLQRSRHGFEKVAFNNGEMQLLNGLGDGRRPEWLLRLWCAKEAAAKALGRGLALGLEALRVTRVEAGAGLVEVQTPAGLITAHTSRHEDFICAIVCQRS
jgi:phosphopantetheinyl transferase